MFARTFIVKYITLKKCFCFLSDKHCRSIQQENVVKLSYGDDKCAYFSVGTFLPTLKENEIGINSMYAQTLQLEENQCVLLVHCNSVPGIKKVNIIPGSNDDYEIMELMAENVQLTLLDQIRIVNNGQKIVIWISNSLHIVVYIDGAEPVAPGRLDYLTEVVVKPPVLPKNDLATKPKPWNINWFLKYFNTTQIRNNSTAFSKYDNTKSTLVFRLYPLEDVASNIDEFNHEAYFNVFLQRDLLHDHSITNNMLFTFRVIQPPSENNDFDDPTSSRKSIVVRLCFLDFTDDVQAQYGCFMPLFISKRIFEHYYLKVGSKAILDYFTGSLDVNAIEISSNKEYSNTIIDKFKLYLANHSKEEKLLLNSEFPLDVGGITVILNFAPSDRSACLIDGDFVRNCKLSVAESDFLVHSARNVEKVAVDLCVDCSNFQEIIDDCTENLHLGLLSNRLENILITGKPGTGKTTIANAFVEKVSNRKTYFHIETINCKNIKGKSTDSLHKLFTSTFLKLIYYQPSVLFLDDLHVMCEKVADGDAATQESIHVNKVSELLGDLLDHYMKNNFIYLLATSESTMQLNKHIFTPRGKHLFKNVFNILDLNKMDRTIFLNYAFSKRAELDDFDMEELALKTEGFVVQDLIDFVDKCIFESYKDETTKILLQQCEIALKNTTSLALKNVQLHSPGDRDFSDIGGLEDIKKVLVESLLWPAQFANIFGKAPLRLQSGLLLYGPPGTGKTILAGAAAKQCGLRLISIKGPELLSKYIGASEQAVRDVFQKAQSAKPCILFFDEFDSLAPRRGHDNTGVTDRVVNQFLTQLDGVEALTGVCVLAATSRPDLLDPALLRPGRLDRQILCPLPDKASRLEILKVLSKTLRLATDIDLDKIAEETKGFSGADLQGVLYTAQLTSVEHLLVENTESSSFENATEINRKHLEEAVKNTRPSLTRAETSKFERIYAKFQGKGDAIDVRAGKQRATLA